MKYLLVLLLLSLSACGGASGTSSGGASLGGVDTTTLPVAGGAPVGPVPHTYELQVTCQGTDFQYAPAIFGVGLNQLSPGPQGVVSGETKSYTLTDTQADIQITGIGDLENNPGFYVSIVILKDGAPVASANVGTGVSQEFKL